MSLDTTIALTSLDEVKAWIESTGGSLEKDGIWIYCSQGDATAATVEVKNNELTLIITGGAQAGTNDLAFATYTTITTLVAAINALTGWTAGAICSGSEDPDDLVITGAVSCLGSANEQTLEIVSNYLLTQLINRASDAIERNCSRILKSRNFTRELYFGSGSRELFLDNWPVSRVQRVSVGREDAFSIKNTSTDMNYATVEINRTTMFLIVDGGTNEDSTELTLSDYSTIDALITAINALGKGWSITTISNETDTKKASEILPRPGMYVDSTTQANVEIPDDEVTEYRLINLQTERNYGCLLRPSVWMPDTEYWVDYTAGYSTIPYALEQACVELVAYKWGRSKRAGDDDLKSESFGEGADYKYEKFNLADIKTALPPELLSQLDEFRKFEF